MSHNHSKGGATVMSLLAIGAVAALAYSATKERRPTRHKPDSAPGYTARQTRFGDYAVSGNTVTIDRPRSELFAFWRDLPNLAQFMENVVEIRHTGEDRAIWTIKGPMGRKVELQTKIVEERQDELMAWKTVEGSDIEAQGKVMFRDAPAGRGTTVEAIIAYEPPAGELGRWVAKAFGREPKVQGRRELKRFKMLMETGEVATADHFVKGD